MSEDPGRCTVDAELDAMERRRAQYRESKRKKRAAGGFLDKKVAVQIELTKEEYLLLCNLERQARNPLDFRKLALMQGAKFRANTGRGRDKIK